MRGPGRAAKAGGRAHDAPMGPTTRPWGEGNVIGAAGSQRAAPAARRPMVHDSRFPRPSGVLGEKHALVVGGLPTFAPSRPAGRNCLDSLSFTRNNELFALLIRGFPSKLSVEKPQETRNPRNGRDFVHAALVACRSVPPRKCQRGRRRGRRGHHGDRGSKEQGAMRAEPGLARAGKRYTAAS